MAPGILNKIIVKSSYLLKEINEQYQKDQIVEKYFLNMIQYYLKYKPQYNINIMII